MRKLVTTSFRTVFFIIILFVIANQLFSQWYPQTSPVASKLNKVYFADSLQGWIVGDDGIILHTIDGGITWIIQNSNTSYNLLNMAFTSKDTGWIVGGGDYNYGGILLHTTDGGSNWDTVFTDSVYYTGISFSSSLNGWVLPHWTICDSLIRTTDGGLTWQKQFLYPGYLLSGGNSRINIFFLDSLHGWIVSQRGAPMSLGCDIYRTSDGGASWTIYIYEIQRLNKVIFTDLSHGWICGVSNGPSGIILFSHDAGATWSPIYPGGNYSNFSDITFVDNIHGWVVSTNGYILVSEDGGMNWDLQYDENLGLNGIYILPGGGKGWVVGDNGTILSTVNGGFPVSIPTSKQRHDIAFYPNPADTKVTVIFPYGTQKTTVNIYNQIGQKITSYNQTKSIIDVSSITPGIYIIEFIGDGKLTLDKIAIQ